LITVLAEYATVYQWKRSIEQREESIRKDLDALRIEKEQLQTIEARAGGNQLALIKDFVDEGGRGADAES